MKAAPRCFVIGHPIAHSRSPLIHGHWLEVHGLSGSYERVDVAPADLPRFMAELCAGAYAGGNVTVPHKEAVMPFLDEITAEARAIGAVNTLFFREGRLCGDNTDIAGFLAHLDASALGWQPTTETALLIGAGGAARGIAYGLSQRGLGRILIANRDPARAERLAAATPRARALPWSERHEAVATADLIVNTTSLGMKGQPPLDLDLAGLRPGTIVDDIVYAPLETELLRRSRQQGARAVDGLGMLLHQAAPGFARWFGVTPQVTPQLRALIEADLTSKG